MSRRLWAVTVALALPGCEWIAGAPAPSLLDAAVMVDARPGLDAAQVMLTVVPRGTGKGKIVSDPAGIDCPVPGPPCSATFASGQPVQLQAMPNADSSFGLWNGDDSCTANPCSVMPTTDRIIEGSLLLPFNVLFVTSTERTPGSLGGRAAADAECATRARAGGYPGSFVAWFSDGSAPDLHAQKGWIRPDGRIVAVDAQRLSFGEVYNPPRLDELGKPVPEGTRVLTDLVHDLRPRDSDHCGGLVIESASRIGFGEPSATTVLWVEAGDMRCDQPARLYCAQTGATQKPPLPVPPAPSKLRAYYYFVDASNTVLGFPVGGGRAAADAACDSVGDTLDAGRPASWIALIATTTESAADRVPDGQTWLRIDGVPLGSSEELKAGGFEAPLNVGKQLEFFGDQTFKQDKAWIGAPSLAERATDESSCKNWTSTQGTGLVAPVSSGRTHFDTLELCTRPHGLWCLELPPP